MRIELPKIIAALPASATVYGLTYRRPEDPYTIYLRVSADGYPLDEDLIWFVDLSDGALSGWGQEFKFVRAHAKCVADEISSDG